MEYIGDKSLPFPKKEDRGIGSNDIPGAISKSRIKGGKTLIYEDIGKATAIKPRNVPFDIINPNIAAEGEGKLHMGKQGMFVLNEKNN